jgi:hypothetical protein
VRVGFSLPLLRDDSQGWNESRDRNEGGLLMAEITRTLAKTLQELAGTAAGEVREMLGDKLHPLRAARRLGVLEKAVQLLRGVGGRFVTVPANILLPILDHASMEDNAQMQAAWAALLANAARQEGGVTVAPVFVEIMKQLSAKEATFLLCLHEYVEKEYGSGPDELELLAAQSIPLGTDVDLLIKYLQLGLGRPKESREQALKNIPGDLRDFMVILDNLERLNLVSYRLDTEAPGWGAPADVKGMDPVRIYHLTMLGYQFIRACRSPQEPAACGRKTTRRSTRLS